MTIIYDLIFVIFAVLYFPYVLLRGKWHSGFWMRMGFLPEELRRRLSVKPNIWFHAVSVGEVLAVAGLVKKVKDSFPEYQIVVTTVTTTGFLLAQSKMPAGSVVVYAPLDCSFVVRAFVRAIQPKVYVTAETELWPNLFAALRREKMPVVLVNGRISERAFTRYQWVRGLLRRVLQSVDVFCMQTSEDAQRIVTLGAVPERVKIIGNMKFDDSGEAPGYKSEDFGYCSMDQVWIAGSTHPGEEEIVLEIYKGLKEKFSNLRLIIAPRHVERTADVVALVAGKGLPAGRFSENSSSPVPSDAVMVVDTIGHLRALYHLASFVFVGKSLTAKGGQNVVEPAFYGKPIIVGPHMNNFKKITDLFVEANAVIQVKDATGLRQAVEDLLKSPQEAHRLGQQAKSVIARHQGATQRTFQVLSGFLVSPGPKF